MQNIWFKYIFLNINILFKFMICPICGKEHDGSFGSGKYCSRSCANTRKHSNNTKQNISNGLHNFYNKHPEKMFIKIKNQYCKFCGKLKNECNNELCKEHQSVNWYKNLIPFGFNYNTIGTEKYIEEHNKVKNILYNEYINNHLSPREIYDKYNCSEYINNSETLLHIFKHWKFNTRGWSQAVSNAFINSKLLIPNNSNHLYGNAQWYTTWNNKEVYLRSNLELNYAKYLDEQHIDYEVEFNHIKYFDTQKQKYRCAIPDFYIPEINTIVEIKGNHTLDIQNMKDKFNAYKQLGYNTKLILENNEVNLYEL